MASTSRSEAESSGRAPHPERPTSSVFPRQQTVVDNAISYPNFVPSRLPADAVSVETPVLMVPKVAEEEEIVLPEEEEEGAEGDEDQEDVRRFYAMRKKGVVEARDAIARIVQRRERDDREGREGGRRGIRVRPAKRRRVGGGGEERRPGGEGNAAAAGTVEGVANGLGREAETEEGEACRANGKAGQGSAADKSEAAGVGLCVYSSSEDEEEDKDEGG